jgi:hypothetical protein
VFQRIGDEWHGQALIQSGFREFDSGRVVGKCDLCEFVALPFLQLADSRIPMLLHQTLLWLR